MKPHILKAACSVFLLIISITVSAQVAAVKFTVQIPGISKEDKGVYLAGSFNCWHEGDSLYRMKEIGNGVYSITIPVFDTKQYYYKYTLGSWNRVEIALNDSDISNRGFISLNGKKIKDTVLKWKQHKSATADSSEQLKRMAAMKDSLMAKIKPELDQMQGLLKQYVQNMLQDKPDKDEHIRLDEKSLQHLGNVYREITQLLWKICTSLSPEQKQQVSKTLSQPVNGDFINSFLAAINNAAK